MAEYNATIRSREAPDDSNPLNFLAGAFSATVGGIVRRWIGVTLVDTAGQVLEPATTGTLDAVLAVTNVSQLAFAAGSILRGFAIENDSDEDFFYAFAATVTTATGIRLYPAERKEYIWGSYEMAYQGPVSIIRAGASGTKNLRRNRW